jgi:hypothetical protein
VHLLGIIFLREAAESDMCATTICCDDVLVTMLRVRPFEQGRMQTRGDTTSICKAIHEVLGQHCVQLLPNVAAEALPGRNQLLRPHCATHT